MQVAQRIDAKLRAGLAPHLVDIVDESHKHAGHMGARPEGETHFRVLVVADAFAGQSRVARQRLVFDVLAEELAGPVHALALRTLTPEEHAAAASD